MLIKLVLFCAFFQQPLKANLPESLQVLQSELVRICDDLVQQTSTSRIEFWFFRESDVAWYAEELSENLIVSEPFVRYPKLLLDESGGFDGSEAGVPTLAFVFLGSSGQVIWKKQFPTCSSRSHFCLFGRVRFKRRFQPNFSKSTSKQD